MRERWLRNLALRAGPVRPKGMGFHHGNPWVATDCSGNRARSGGNRFRAGRARGFADSRIGNRRADFVFARWNIVVRFVNLDRYLWQNPITLGLPAVALVERRGG